MAISEIFDRSILVVAHPDDEALWFSSILEKVGSICFSYLDYSEELRLSKGRREVIRQYPLSNLTCLSIEEPRSFNLADWDNPIESEFGLKLTSNRAAESRYQKSYLELVRKLERELKDVKNVFTHNPWGEYGHEDHVQTFKAVKFLSSKYGYKIWFSNYCGNRSIPLMLKSISGFNTNYITLKTNIELANKLLELYKLHSCWTWYDNYHWFKEESFIQMPLNSDLENSYGHMFPLNFIKTNFNSKKTAFSQIKERVRKRIRKKIRSSKYFRQL
jgi:LmbE family N-acetylglucosaminyl deacetylase